MLVPRNFLNFLPCPTWNYQRGGAIHVVSADVTIYDTEFISNDGSEVCGWVLVPRIFLNFLYVPGPTWNYQRGGAIYGVSADVTTYDTEFISNDASEVYVDEC